MGIVNGENGLAMSLDAVVVGGKHLCGLPVASGAC